MKKLWFLACLIILLWACQEHSKSRKEIIEENINKWIQEYVSNPNDFKIEAIVLYDSITISDNIEFRRRDFQKDREFNMNHLDGKGVDELNEIINGIDSIEQALGDKLNNVLVYKYVMRANSKNFAYGARTTQDYYIIVDSAKTWDIIQITSDFNKLFLNPKDFPGYQELVLRISNKYDK